MQIVHQDRGIDFRRLERIVKMLNDESYKIYRAAVNKDDELRKQREKDVYKHFGLEGELAAIKKIDGMIDNLRESRAKHEAKIREVFQPADRRHGDYSYIREGSDADKYINEGLLERGDLDDQLNVIKDKYTEKIWLAKDIDEVSSLYAACLDELKTLV